MSLHSAQNTPICRDEGADQNRTGDRDVTSERSVRCPDGVGSQQGWVYALVLNRERIKIGFSRDPDARIAGLRRKHGPLGVLVCFPATLAEERAWNRRFSHLALGHEWFRYDPELYDVLTAHAEVRRAATEGAA